MSWADTGAGSREREKEKGTSRLGTREGDSRTRRKECSVTSGTRLPRLFHHQHTPITGSARWKRSDYLSLVIILSLSLPLSRDSVQRFTSPVSECRLPLRPPRNPRINRASQWGSQPTAISRLLPMPAVTRPDALARCVFFFFFSSTSSPVSSFQSADRSSMASPDVTLKYALTTLLTLYVTLLFIRYLDTYIDKIL